MIEIIVYGIPGPQGSKSAKGKNAAGHVILVESSAKVTPWREAVKFATLQVMRDQQLTILRGPIHAEMIFTVLKPKSASKTRKTFPDRKPDLSKLIRSTEDALTDIGAWEDDARVISLHAEKVYPRNVTAGDVHRDGLDRPGVVIRLRSAEDFV